MIINPYQRQGQMGFLQSYFYTDTIYDFKHLLVDDNIKLLIIESWKYLINAGKIKIYGYVIMPNHIHLIWDMLELNGKESPAGSFAKFTAHQFKKYLQQSNALLLEQYKSNKSDRQYQFWKRDPLAISLTTEKSFLQKLEYIHMNPIRPKWRLADIPESYRWSSARFYENGTDEFGVVSHYMD
ncbi:MAG: transposase [Ferruginibacter sp.]